MGIGEFDVVMKISGNQFKIINTAWKVGLLNLTRNRRFPINSAQKLLPNSLGLNGGTARCSWRSTLLKNFEGEVMRVLGVSVFIANQIEGMDGRATKAIVFITRQIEGTPFGLRGDESEGR